MAETKEYLTGALRKGDRPTGEEIAVHLESALAALPPWVNTVYARADSGFYCWEAVEAYEKRKCRFIRGWSRRKPRMGRGECVRTARPETSPAGS